MKRAKWGLAIGALAMAASAGADVRQGVEAWRNGDFASAVAQWQPLAETGDPDAQFNLGQAYKLGRGVPQDMDRARELFAAAARQGHLQAEANYGLMLFQEGNREAAMPWIIRAANRGEARAQYIYGTALYNGDLAERDWVRAYAMMSRAAAQGVPQAARSLELLDVEIPAEQREAGLALARQLEAGVAGTAIASATPPPDPQPASSPAPQPEQQAATAPAPQQQQQSAEPPQTAWELPPAAPRPGPARQRQPEPRTATVRPATPEPTPETTRVARSGDWRIQLGAFSERARAENHWRSMGRVAALSGLQPYLVAAGRLTRLQAGPFGTEAEAERACVAARRAGSECITARRQ